MKYIDFETMKLYDCRFIYRRLHFSNYAFTMMNSNTSQATNIDIQRKNIQNLYLRIRSYDAIQVTAPMGMPLAEIHAFIQSKLTWIKKQQTKLMQHAHILNSTKKFCDNEIHYVHEKPYPLKIIAHSGRPKVHLIEEEMFLYVPPFADTMKKKSILEKWYSEKLKSKVHELVRYWEPQMGVSVKRIIIRKMKTRWGSCSPHTQSIRINLDLAKHSLKCLEYIVVHELTHLLEASHNKRFARLMDEFLPDWKERKIKLNRDRLLFE